ncbi:YolA family protein [Eubacterium sp. MSJ-13]|uniref:DUF4879 domain-containing protein n=1 Tax=Eubacterium sp. MSJ-13 TaxID=2841513 RepID=UPI001C10BDEC|nr:DUF4879 domain-containing protein [Eubacterium sp. MSJ-13]MBU5477945.1 YolA family protein [Eubacterium sp. MSJ-13]
MFKRLRRIVALMFAFVMIFSTTAFAAENDNSDELKITMENVEYSYDGQVSKAPAAAVSSVTIVSEEAYINSKGNVIIPVYIVGYGHNEIAKWDATKAKYVKDITYTRADRVVYAFKQYWNCGKAVAGKHTFKFSTTSINSPWNTVSAIAQFKISK